MIAELHLQNFQSHRDSKLKFSNGVNVIIGMSDQGKSAIIRSLNLLFRNKPSGKSFISHNEKETSIYSKINGHQITRKKGIDNIYIIDGKNVVPLSQAPPEDIANLTHFSDINIQLQLDSPFLISQNNSYISKYINKIVDFECIDRTLLNAKKLKQQCKNDQKYLDAEKNDINIKIQELMYIEQIEKKFDILYNQYTMLQKMKKKHYQLCEIIEYIDNINIDIEKWNKKSQIDEIINELLEKIKKYEKINNGKKILNDVINNFCKYESLYNNLYLKQKNKQKTYNKLMPNICPLCNQEQNKGK